MELKSKYEPVEIEDKWYEYWLKNQYFKAQVNPNKKPYSIVIPPPNITGVLHMGHMLNNTIQDILIRKARMENFEACWVPGTDHASIATEAKVVSMLRDKGIKKSSLSRDEFLKYAFEWKEKYGNIILEQLKKLGASCDWDRTAFTLDDGYYKAVIRVFKDLYQKGYIYRGNRMINWDVEAKTTISSEEVVYNEEGEEAELYTIKYQIKGTNDFLAIATLRPETIMGDVAIAINPNDTRYKHLVGKTVLVPFINREIPVITDNLVEIEFGTGCLKVTPAHAVDDYDIGIRHNLEIIDTLNDDGTLNEKCEIPKFVGKDRFEVRKEIVDDLKKASLLLASKTIITKIGRSERTNTIIEPKLSLQWFIRMKDFSKRALEAVKNDEIILYPSKFKNTYNHWMENVKDWCISRQLWWGQQIPVYYYGEGENDFVVAENKEEALSLAQKITKKSDIQLKQDEDVLDTWASSWLFPLAVFDGFNDTCFDANLKKIIKNKNADLNYFYPTDTLVTAPEILFFWVARMIISGYEYTGEKPFKNVYLTGIVRDEFGRKMSKQLGNSPDALGLIAQYGADSVRVGMLFCSPAGNDLLYKEKLIEQGRNFANKIWNAFRLINSWKSSVSSDNNVNNMAIDWFEAVLNKTILEINELFQSFRISEALMSIYKLIWDSFCSRYLEWVKPPYGEPINQQTLEKTIAFTEKLLKLLHPFMPFITEEIWQTIQERNEKETICLQAWPIITKQPDNKIIDDVELMFEIIAQIRNYRNKNQISPKVALDLAINGDKIKHNGLLDYIIKLANISNIEFTTQQPENSFNFVIQSNQYFLILKNNVVVDTEKNNIILESELAHLKNFKKSIEAKFNNPKFVENAPPQVLENEKKKLNDTIQKIETIEKMLKN